MTMKKTMFFLSMFLFLTACSSKEVENNQVTTICTVEQNNVVVEVMLLEEDQLKEQITKTEIKEYQNYYGNEEIMKEKMEKKKQVYNSFAGVEDAYEFQGSSVVETTKIDFSIADLNQLIPQNIVMTNNPNNRSSINRKDIMQGLENQGYLCEVK